MANTERTFIMIKPDGVQRGLISKIIKRFESKGFKLVSMKFMWVCSCYRSFHALMLILIIDADIIIIFLFNHLDVFFLL